MSQDFDPVKVMARVAQLEKVIFGHDVPDYVVQPTADEPYPPIREEHKRGADGRVLVDRFQQPIMQQKMLRKPGLLDVVHALQSGQPLAGEGGATNAQAVLDSLAGLIEGPAPKKTSKKKAAE